MILNLSAFSIVAHIKFLAIHEHFSDFKVMHTRFSRWAKVGIWQRVFEVLSHDSNNEYAILDSTIVRAHQHSAGGKKSCDWTQ